MSFETLPEAADWAKACQAVKLESDKELWTALAVLYRVPESEPEKRLALLPRILKLALDFRKSKVVVAAGPKAVKLVQELIDAVPKSRRKFEAEVYKIQAEAARKVDVQIIVVDWNGKPLDGAGAFTRWESPGFPTIHRNGKTSANGFAIDDLRLRPEGTVSLSIGGAPAIVGATDYELKAGKAVMKFRAIQHSQKLKAKAKRIDEVKKKLGIKGNVGLAFRILSVGGELARESEYTRGYEKEVEWELEAGLPTFKDFRQI